MTQFNFGLPGFLPRELSDALRALDASNSLVLELDRKIIKQEDISHYEIATVAFAVAVPLQVIAENGQQGHPHVESMKDDARRLNRAGLKFAAESGVYEEESSHLVDDLDRILRILFSMTNESRVPVWVSQIKSAIQRGEES